jgi:ribosomal-protein-alanine N-acetyltransferase
VTSIRAATHADAEAVAALEARVFGDLAWSGRAIAEEFASLTHTRLIFVAVDCGRLIGYAALLAVGDTGDLTRVAVQAERRRSGVGTQLVEAALRQARALGIRRVLLEVEAGNGAAVAMYERNGFETIDRRAAYYADGTDALVMAKRLNGGETEEARR